MRLATTWADRCFMRISKTLLSLALASFARGTATLSALRRAIACTVTCRASLAARALNSVSMRSSGATARFTSGCGPARWTPLPSRSRATHTHLNRRRLQVVVSWEGWVARRSRRVCNQAVWCGQATCSGEVAPRPGQQELTGSRAGAGLEAQLSLSALEWWARIWRGPCAARTVEPRGHLAPLAPRRPQTTSQRRSLPASSHSRSRVAVRSRRTRSSSP
mmetsp:Transcript_35362/g.112592  ORF Transcript_35362/g.112592 Transcript_35362/m.112592 type:complete len:220 (-) Transcript_35362:463-1122(-)